jgi:hypothetical protein
LHVRRHRHDRRWLSSVRPHRDQRRESALRIWLREGGGGFSFHLVGIVSSWGKTRVLDLVSETPYTVRLVRRGDNPAFYDFQNSFVSRGNDVLWIVP